MSLLSVRGLRKAFGGVVAVADLSFEIAAGEVVALIGPNGAGKTTCFNLLAGQLRPDAGSIRFDGIEVAGLPPPRIWRLGLGRSFQIAAAFPSMTARENVQAALISHHRRLRAVFPAAGRCFRGEADALLDRVGLADQADRAAAVLAYGDLKRLELALALAHGPRLLLLDEPTAGVAEVERRVLMAAIAAIVGERGVAVLFTEHDMDVVFGFAARIIVLHRGSVIADGPPEAVRASPRVREIYLGTDEGPAPREGGR